jgi:hypothetical protein
LREHPEETSTIIQYFQLITLNEIEIQLVTNFLESDDAIYDYQLYQIIKWLFDNSIVTATTLECARKWAKDANRVIGLRSYATLYLGQNGDASDLDSIEELYASRDNWIEKSDIVMAIVRQEKGRRNAFYTRVQNDDDWVNRAIKLVKTTIPQPISIPQEL